MCFLDDVVNYSYSNFEIIFWYSAFVVVLIVFIFYIRGKKNRKKYLDNVLLRIRKEIDKYNNLVIKINKNERITRDEFSKTIFLLANLDSKFIELKEVTKLGDCDKLLEESKKLSVILKKEKAKKGCHSVSDLEAIIDSLNCIYTELELLNDLVK